MKYFERKTVYKVCSTLDKKHDSYFEKEFMNPIDVTFFISTKPNDNIIIITESTTYFYENDILIRKLVDNNYQLIKGIGFKNESR